MVKYISNTKSFSDVAIRNRKCSNCSRVINSNEKCIHIEGGFGRYKTIVNICLDCLGSYVIDNMSDEEIEEFRDQKKVVTL